MEVNAELRFKVNAIWVYLFRQTGCSLRAFNFTFWIIIHDRKQNKSIFTVKPDVLLRAICGTKYCSQENIRFDCRKRTSGLTVIVF